MTAEAETRACWSGDPETAFEGLQGEVKAIIILTETTRRVWFSRDVLTPRGIEWATEQIVKAATDAHELQSPDGGRA